MSIRAMYSAVSGLRAHQERMDVVGNNIANVNTVGYKSSRTTFSQIFSQTLRPQQAATSGRGAVNPLQIGSGVKLASVDPIFTQGTFQTTGRLFDLAIDGEGFFALTDNVNNISGQQLLTRAGNFGLDPTGYVVNPSTGYVLLGRMADESGVISDASSVQAIQIDTGMVVPATQTSNVVISGNIDALGTPAGASAINNVRSLFNAEGKALSLQVGDVLEFGGGTVGAANAAGTDIVTITEDTTLGDVVSAIQAAINGIAGSSATVNIDEQGHVLFTAGTVNLTDLTVRVQPGSGGARETAANTILAAIFDDGVGVAGISATSGGSQVTTTGWVREADIATSIDVVDSRGETRSVTLSFCRDTSAATPNNTVNYQVMVPHINGNDVNGSFAAGTTGTLVFDSDGTLQTSSISALTFDPDGSYDMNGGVDPLSINLDVSRITQFSAPNTVTVDSQDGQTQGDLDSYTIDDSGVIRGVFSNGMTREIAQVLIASVSNQEGLESVGDTMFRATMASGDPILGEASLRGRGSISSGTLELSNVDLASEFTDLIISQRGFQANARVITASDEVLRDIVNIK
jgi:flagellar hook protein FlgE